MSESRRDYGYTIVTVVINGHLVATRRLPRPDYNRMKACNVSAFEQFQFDIINDGLNNYFKLVNSYEYAQSQAVS